MKNTVSTLQKMKNDGEKITSITCYDYTTATLVEKSGINAVLVGDSLGMTMLGYPDTLAVTMEDMIHHTAAVSRGLKDTFLISDMPFMSYEADIAEAVRNAGRLIKEGHAQSVKLEGGATVKKQIRAIVDANIPVCAHIGLTPQSINAFGGFKVQGKTLDAARQIIEDALDVQEAGAFAVVLECIPAKLASIITDTINIPTIGIGAGAGCDGQILVYQDMLGLYMGLAPKFAKHFAEAGELFVKGFSDYAAGVRDGSFPAEEHTFPIDSETAEVLRKEYVK